MRSLHSGWWEHKVFPTLCELQEMFSYCLPVVISFTSSSFLSLMPRSILRKRLRGSPAGFQSTLFLGISIFFITLPHRFVCLTSLNCNLFSLPQQDCWALWVSLLVLWPGNCLQAVTGDQLLSLEGYIYLFIFHSISVSQL